MKKYILLFLGILPLTLFGQVDANKALNLFNSLYGTTGNILTSNAYTVGKFKGNIGVFENFDSDFNDNLIFNFGVHEQIEVGIQTGIPTHPDARMNFFFKIRANNQGEYFGLKNKWIPVTAFGINRDNAFAVASYDFNFLQFSVGYNFSDNKQGIFSNLNIPIKKIVAIQVEYVNKTISGGLRIRYKGITVSLVYSQLLEELNFDDSNAFWEVSYHF